MFVGFTLTREIIVDFRAVLASHAASATLLVPELASGRDCSIHTICTFTVYIVAIAVVLILYIMATGS